MRSYTFCIKNVRKDNNVVCTNPKIVWLQGYGQAFPCKEKKGCMEVVVPDDISACVRGEVICEECGPGVSKTFEICPCTTAADCAACSSCVGGLCVSNCVNNEECEEGQCVCPDDLPFKDPSGKCVQCLEGVFISNCEVCVNGVIEHKACAGVCDPDTGDCVNCISATQCLGRADGKNCCSNGACVCCSGNHYNPALGICEPDTTCLKDSDCPSCQNCVSGSCTPLVCPTGYVCQDGGCKKICDCSNPSCPTGSVCYPYSATECFCRKCEGTGPCLPGCELINGNCAPSPCNAPCDPFTPCPTGCGCQNGRCVSCSSLNCNNCTIPGCSCQNNVCAGTPCSGPCDPGNPCGAGCGCKDNTCAPCEKTCNTQDDCYLGCYCDEVNHTCKANPCQYKTCSNPSDCGRDCTCYEGRCIPCSAFSCAECASIPGCVCDSTNTCQSGITGGCNDELSLELTSDCKLQATLTKTGCCNCDEVYVDIEFTVNTSVYTVNGYLRSGNTNTSTLLGSLGIANNLPIQGEVEFIPELRLRKISDNSFTTLDYTSVNIDFAPGGVGTDTVTGLNGGIWNVGDTITYLGAQYKVEDICFYVKGVQVFKFANECEYSLGRKAMLCSKTTGAKSGITRLEKLVACRVPIFNWYKDDFSTPYRREYGYRVNSTTYKSDFIASEGLQTCHKYSVEADCTCTPITRQYSCNNDDVATNLVVYQPESLHVTQSNACNDTIIIDQVIVCSLLVGKVYKLYINGVDVSGSYTSALTVQSGGQLFMGNTTVTYTEPITEIKLCYPCDDCNKCLIIPQTYGGDCFTCSNQEITLTLSGDCTLGITATGTLEQISPNIPLAGIDVNIYLDDVWYSTVTTDGAGLYSSTIPVTNNKTYRVKAKVGNCTISKTFSITDCCGLLLTGVNYDCGTGLLNSTASGCSGVLTMTVYDIDNVPVTTPGDPYVGSLPVALANGTYSLEVFCDGTCSKTVPFSIGCAPPDFVGSVICDSSTPKVEIGTFTNMTYPGTASVWVMSTNAVPNPSSTPTFTISVPSSSTIDFAHASLLVNKYVFANLTDSLGNTGGMKYLGKVPDCSIPCFEILSANVTCDPTPPDSRVCVTLNAGGLYNVQLLDGAMSDAITPQNNVSFSAGVERCVPTSAVYIAPGAYTVKVTSVSNPLCVKTMAVTVSTCASYSVTYNCTQGLVILQDGSPWTGKIRVDNLPTPSYWSYAGPNTSYVTDGNHSVQLFSSTNTLLATVNVSSVDCCTVQIENASGICIPNTANGTIEFTPTGGLPTEDYNVQVIDQATNTVVDTDVSFAGGLYQTDVLPTGDYLIKVTDNNYHIANVGTGIGTQCEAEELISLECLYDCGLTSSKVIVNGYYQKDCLFNTNFTKTAVTVINQHSFAIDVQVYYKYITPASGPCGVPPFPGSGYLYAGPIGNIPPSGRGCLPITVHPAGYDTCIYVSFNKHSNPCPDIAYAGPVKTVS